MSEIKKEDVEPYVKMAKEFAELLHNAHSEADFNVAKIAVLDRIIAIVQTTSPSIGAFVLFEILRGIKYKGEQNRVQMELPFTNVPKTNKKR